jgi:hypothetical protein
MFQPSAYPTGRSRRATTDHPAAVARAVWRLSSNSSQRAAVSAAIAAHFRNREGRPRTSRGCCAGYPRPGQDGSGSARG